MGEDGELRTWSLHIPTQAEITTHCKIQKSWEGKASEKDEDEMLKTGVNAAIRQGDASAEELAENIAELYKYRSAELWKRRSVEMLGERRWREYLRLSRWSVQGQGRRNPKLLLPGTHIVVDGYIPRALCSRHYFDNF